jgi:hypothetical protein
MAKKSLGTSSPSNWEHKVAGSNREHSGAQQLHVTAGAILTPVLGFRGSGVTGMPPAPEARGFTNKPGDGNLPSGAKRKMGGNDAMKAFGLNGTGKNDQ